MNPEITALVREKRVMALCGTQGRTAELHTLGADAIERLSAENDDNIERWQLYQSLCDEIMAEKEAAEADAANHDAVLLQLLTHGDRQGLRLTEDLGARVRAVVAAHAARRGQS